MKLGPLLFEPIYRSYVWGDRNFERLFGRVLPPEVPTAESWEVSDVDGAISRVESGPFAGHSLRELCREFAADMFGEQRGSSICSDRRFPLLVKFLDAERVLSVQVHPGDQFAAEYENGSFGKTEMWFIVEARGNAEVIAGLRPGTTRAEFLEAAQSGSPEPFLQRHRVRAGDVVLVPAGRVHAMGAGIVALEIQQTSDITYRLHDWGRVGPDGKPRPLHLDRAIEVIDFSDEGRAVTQPVQRTEDWGVWSLLGVTLFFLTESFSQFRSVPCTTRSGSPDILVAMNGSLRISWDHGDVIVPPERTALVPSCVGPYVLEATEDTLVVRSRVPDRSNVLGDWTPRSNEERTAVLDVCDTRVAELVTA